MNNRKYFIIILFLFPLFSSFNITPISTHSGDTVNAPIKTTDPIIDGIFNILTEWNDAVVIHWTVPFEVYAYVKFNETYLYICADAIGDTVSNMFDYVMFVFDTDHDGNPTPDHDDEFLMYALPAFLHLIDDSNPGYAPLIHCDFTSHAGLIGAIGFGASPNSGTNHEIYEIQIPLDLLNVSSGDTLGFGIYVYNWDTSVASVWPSGFVSGVFTTYSDLILPDLPSEELLISDITQAPSTPSSDDIVEITANITCMNEVVNASVWYSVDGGGWNQRIMNLIAGTTQDGMWKGIIPPNPLNSSIIYFIEASNNVSITIKEGPFNYTVTETDPPEFINISQIPTLPIDTDIVRVNVSLKDASGVDSAQLIYQINSSGGWNIINLTLLQGTFYDGIWNGTIPAFNNGTIIQYYINVTDIVNNNLVNPDGAPVNIYGYIVGGTDNDAPPIISKDFFPSNPAYHDNVTITAVVNVSTEISGLKNLTLCYVTNEQSLNYKLMVYSNLISVNLLNYSITLPSFSYYDTINFNVTSYDIVGNSFSTNTSNFTIDDLDSPEIITLSQNPVRPDISEDVQINITIHEPNLASGVKNATLYYEVEELTFISIKSPHPVPDLYSYTWNISVPEGIIQTLYFENISLEDGFDYLYIYNGSYGFLDSVTGDVNRYSVQINDDTARIQIRTDMAIKSWGFYLSMIKVWYNITTVPLTLISGNEFDGIWNSIIPAKGSISTIYYFYDVFDNASNSILSNISSYKSAEINLPNINAITQYPSGSSVLPTDTPQINATISDDTALHYNNSVILQYKTTIIWNNLSMEFVGDSYFPQSGIWTATLPNFPDGIEVIYRIIAQDLADNTIISSNYSYICDGTAPILTYAKYSPIQPNYNESVLVTVNISDTYPSSNGAGIDKISIEYSYDIAYNLESPHPYLNNYTQRWFINYSSAYGILIHFSRVDLQFADFINIRDNKGNVIDTILLSVVDYWTIPIYSDNTTIELVADSIANEYGFIIDQISIINNSTSSLKTGSIYNGMWEGTIPSFPFGSEISFQIIATDKVGNSGIVHSGAYTVTDIYQPQILQCNISVENPTPKEDVKITICLLEEGAGIDNVILYISLDGGLTWHSLPFENISANLWVCTIPKQPHNTKIKYYIVILDKNGNYVRNPTVGSSTIIFQYSISASDLLMWILLSSISIAAAILIILFFRSKKTIRRKELKLKMKKPKKYGEL